MATQTTAAGGEGTVDRRAERTVIFASSLGTVFEWYDFYIYATLAPFFAALFFPAGNATTALLASFATYAAGFLVRPFGALVFGRIGDLVGRKYTFLVTIMVMGLSTAAVGILPTYGSIGMLSPTILVLLRLAQGLALGGEYGGAATYVAEHAPDGKRGLHTSWIQTTATLGFFLSIIIIGSIRSQMAEPTFKTWGWRIPFLISLVLLALFGAAAGQGVVWYTGQFYALFFLTGTLKISWQTAYFVMGVSLALATGLFVFFGWLSDKIGRKKIMMVGCLLGAVTYFPIYHAMAHYGNPALEKFSAETPISLTANNCQVHLFPNPKTVYSECDKIQDFLSKRSLSYETTPGPEGAKSVLKLKDTTIEGFDEKKMTDTLKTLGYPAKAKDEEVNKGMLILLIFIQLIYVTMVYGPIAAFLVELFPTRIRYTSMSFPYHIGNGWFGGMLPLTTAAVVAANGNIFSGLWYPVIVAAVTLVIGTLFIREKMDKGGFHDI